jgi:hypothetical protein
MVMTIQFYTQFCYFRYIGGLPSLYATGKTKHVCAVIVFFLLVAGEERVGPLLTVSCVDFQRNTL